MSCYKTYRNMPKNNFNILVKRDYTKCKRVVRSCKTEEQLASAWRMCLLFRQKHTDFLEIDSYFSKLASLYEKWKIKFKQYY